MLNAESLAQSAGDLPSFWASIKQLLQLAKQTAGTIVSSRLTIARFFGVGELVEKRVRDVLDA